MIQGMRTQGKHWFPAILLVLATGIVVYSNTFQVPFVLDDNRAIARNDVIWSLDNFGSGYNFLPNRYVAYLTFALNYHFGGLDLPGYHAVNLAIHLACALLVFALLLMTFLTPFFRVRGGNSDLDLDSGQSSTSTFSSPRAFIPLFAALLFVAHPVQTQAVTYVVQRITSLATMFYLLSVVLYVAARLRLEARGTRHEEKGTSHESRVTSHGFLFLFAGSVFSAILAMKTKEIAFTLPLAILLYEACFFRGPWKRRLLCLLPLLATLPIVPMTVLDVGGTSSDIQPSAGQAGLSLGDQLRADSSVSRLDYLFTQFRVIVTYLRLLVLPVNQNLDYDYPVYTTFFTPPVFLSFLLLTALFALALYLWFSSSLEPRASRLISFGILWFFLTLAVESSLIPIDDVIMEHRLYLPVFGAVTAFAAAFWLVAERLTGVAGGRLLVSVAALLALGLGLATWQRNQVWGDSVRLWQDVAAKSPNKRRALNNLGVALTDAGRPSEAIETLSRAMALKPLSLNVYNNLGKAYIMNGQSEAALPLLKKAIELDRQASDSYINLAMAYNQLRQFLNTIALLEQNRHWIGDRVEAHYHLGVAYAFLGYREAASRKLEIVEGRDPVLAADLRRLLE